MFYDVFNGDADGICALQQLRLAEPAETHLVTGIKRDIKLLDKIEPAANDHVTVLDISLDKNHSALLSALQAGAKVQYFDHHMATEIPDHPNLDAHIDTTADVCTSLIVNHYLQGQQLAWAVVGAFGDNLYDSACQAAQSLSLAGQDLDALRELGTCLNYNGYGTSIEDLFFPPDELFRQLHPYANPLDFIKSESAYQVLQEGYAEDLNRVKSQQPEIEEEQIALYILPDAKWARRISGVFANQLARQTPDRAHALLSEIADGSFLVSVRAPLNNKTGAGELCSQFPSGGGRQAAAGINRLEASQYDEFVAAFRAIYSNNK